MKVLAIGDPHFKHNNGAETAMMESRILSLIIDHKPEIVVILGDILHTHERIRNEHLTVANNFIKRIRRILPSDAYLYVLIGNHDRCHNKVYCTDQHPFGLLELWPNTFLGEKPLIHEFTSRSGMKVKNVLMPYVEAGRFAEALGLVGLHDETGYKMKGITAVYSHQEFKGAKMNAITSNDGDPWPFTNPLVISGHIHDYHRVQPNLIYTGTPIQHGYADTVDKTVSFFTFDVEEGEGADVLIRWEEERVSLGVPKRLQITMTPEELLTFVLPANTIVKIKLVGPPEQTRPAMELVQVKALLAQGVEIKCHDTTVQKAAAAQIRSNPLVPYATHLAAAVKVVGGDIEAEYRRLCC